MEFKLTIKGMPDFSKLSAEMKSPEQFLNDVQKIRRNSFYINIASGKNAKGKSFKPLTQVYAKYKRSRVGNKPILSFSGEMIAKYTSDVSGNSLIERVNSPLALYHQEGLGNLPKRQILPTQWTDLPKSERNAIESAATNFVDDIVARLAKQSALT